MHGPDTANAVGKKPLTKGVVFKNFFFYTFFSTTAKLRQTFDIISRCKTKYKKQKNCLNQTRDMADK